MLEFQSRGRRLNSSRLEIPYARNYRRIGQRLHRLAPPHPASEHRSDRIDRMLAQ
ncbi:hypothetical protein [Burkholderia sp. Bp8992]|uniref:hypothetical protein n=1 Tax=Burkholderia sp. Bp8992 TaxID=2184554 RepID=UPI0016248518|nr:hypothetical protein [Burkholderia sp. Bp8992]